MDATTRIRILCLLCVCACPTFSTRLSAQTDPDVVTAMSDEAVMAQALDFVYIDNIDIFVSLENLDDETDPGTVPSYDYINDNGGVYVLRPEKGYFEPTKRNLLATWLGPYILYQGGVQTGPNPYDRGSPLDPWGNPYYLFSPLGLLRGDTGAFTNELYGDQFDRYAIVSLGPDRFMSGDDIIRLFGIGVTGAAVSSIVGGAVGKFDLPTGTVYRTRHGQIIIIRGENFGATQGTSSVCWGSIPLIVLSWSNTVITVQLPDNLFGTDFIIVKIGATQTNGLELEIIPNRVEEWSAYE